MVVLGRRYPGCSFHHGQITDTFGQTNGFSGNGGGGAISGADGGIFTYGEASRPYVCPARYSQVRKVTFWAAFRHETTGAQITPNVRLRIAPASTSTTARTVESIIVPPSTIVRTFVAGGGGGQVWSQVTIADEAVFYPWNGDGNQIPLRRYTTITTSGAQLVTVDFDRFESGSAEFFQDWDTVAANGDLDEYLAYWIGIQRVDSTSWVGAGTGNSNYRPTLIGCGFTVVQAPAAENNSCQQIACTVGTHLASGVGTSFGSASPFLFNYRAADWNNIEAIYLIARQTPSSGVGNRGHFAAQIQDRVDQSLTSNTRFTETWNSLTTGTVNFLARSGNILSSIQDGDNLGVAWRNAEAVGNIDIPWGWFEVVQRNHTKTTAFFWAGIGTSRSVATIRPAAPPPAAFGTDESLFDPLWFENLEDEFFINQRVFGCVRHNSAGNDVDQQDVINADLAADVPTSVFNQIIDPEISSTPNATVGFKVRYGAITSNNPLNLAGQRKLKTRFGGTVWVAGGDDTPGGMGLAYSMMVPNAEVPERGPIFDQGAFDPEGCASTAAGLGDPGVLVITNGSVIPKKFNPAAAGLDQEIEDAGIPTPFEGEVPSSTVDDAVASPEGGLQAGIYVYRYTFRNCCTGKESDPNPDDIVVDTSDATPAAEVTLSFAGVTIPSDAQICEICIYRTVESGVFPVMAKVGCFDPNDSELFVDTVSDEALDFTNDGLSLLNAPMPCVPIVVDYRNRLFGMGDIPNLTPEGSVTVVDGSDIVTGDDDVDWTRCLEGKTIHVGDDCRGYEILRLLAPVPGASPAFPRLKLTEPYEGASGTGLSYTICGRPNRLYFSEPLEPEYWPAANFLDVEPGDGDRLMGAVSNFDRLVICKRRKSYVLTFRESPGLEVIVPSRISSDIGCIGPRTFAQVESGSVWLADRGLAIFDGRTVMHVPESQEMNDIFTDPDNENYIRRDRNGRVIEAVGVFYPAREQYLLILPTVQTNRGCNLMLVWDVKLKNITLLRFCQEFLAMVVAKDAEGNERVYLGDTNGFVWIYDVGYTDGIGFPNATGTVRGTVTAAGTDAGGASFFEDSTASFVTGGLPELAGLSGVVGLSGAFGGDDLGIAGACVAIRPADASPDDPWDVRFAYAATPTRIYVTPSWSGDVPEAGFEYMLGPIEFTCIFKPQNYQTDDFLKRDWFQVLVHEPELFRSEVRCELLPDLQLSDPLEEAIVTDEDTGIRAFRMDYSKGRQRKPTGKVVHNFMAVKMTNYAPEEPIRIINHLLLATPRQSR